MKTFLAVFTGTAAAMEKFKALDETTRQERTARGMTAWENWMKEHAKDVVANGGPLGKTKRVDPNGVTDIRNNLAAYVTVRAESHEAAAKMFLGHPHFSIFPGDGVEIMECLPIPTRG